LLTPREIQTEPSLNKNNNNFKSFGELLSPIENVTEEGLNKNDTEDEELPNTQNESINPIKYRINALNTKNTNYTTEARNNFGGTNTNSLTTNNNIRQEGDTGFKNINFQNVIIKQFTNKILNNLRCLK